MITEQLSLQHMLAELEPNHHKEQDIVPEKSSTFAMNRVLGVAALASVVCLCAGFLIGQSVPQISIGNASGATLITASSHVSVYHDKGNMKQWRDLEPVERRLVKQEALKRFPEIHDIGQGVEWRPVAEWMAEEKGVAVSNVRDLFR